jgi:Ca2+-binding RTX toxin-like protein
LRGNDTIDGLGGADTIRGDRDDDAIVYRPDAALLDGGAGQDRLIPSSL